MEVGTVVGEEAAVGKAESENQHEPAGLERDGVMICKANEKQG